MSSFAGWEWINAFPFSPTPVPSTTRINHPRWRTDLPTDPAIYSAENFDPRPPNELMCTVCLGVYRDPVECPCRHVFCSDCINGWLENGTGFGAGACPVCRRVTSATQLVPVLPLVNNLIARLTVRCPNHASGCSAKVSMESLNRHLESCPYSRTPCPDCGSPILPSELSVHQRERCSKRLVRCSRECGLNLTADRVRSHSCSQEMRNHIVSLERQTDHWRQSVQRLQRQVDELTSRLAMGSGHGYMM